MTIELYLDVNQKDIECIAWGIGAVRDEYHLRADSSTLGDRLHCRIRAQQMQQLLLKLTESWQKALDRDGISAQRVTFGPSWTEQGGK